MGKETREMLKTIISNTELIMKHLNISKPGIKSEKKSAKPAAKKTPVKKSISKK